MTTPATREEVVAVLREALTAWMRARMTGRDDIGTILTALEQHGLAIVPVEATKEQRLAANQAFGSGGFSWNAGQVSIVVKGYRAMILASPYNKETGNG